MEDKYYQLINHHLSGEITEEDEARLKDWLNASDENRQRFAKMEKLWHRYQPVEPETIPHLDQAWSKLETSLGIDATKPPATVFPLEKSADRKPRVFFQTRDFRTGLAIAASLLLILLAHNLWQNLKWQSHVTKNAEQVGITLPDQSVVKLNADSEIKFLKEFSDGTRLVSLRGQAFFDVISESRPFIVETETARIRVIGTNFDVWSRNGKTEVIVKEGTVLLQSIVGDSPGQVILKANEKSSLFSGTQPNPPEQVDAQYLIGWLENRFVFYKTPLSEAIAEMQRRYDIKIGLAEERLGTLSMSGAFEQQSVDSTLASFCLALNLNYTFDGRAYIVSQ